MFCWTRFFASNKIICCEVPRYSCKRFSAIIALSDILATSGVLAQTANPETSDDQANASAPTPRHLGRNITLASQYIVRGFHQTFGKSALQGGVNYATANGVLFGA